jgi:hypothetical protein
MTKRSHPTEFEFIEDQTATPAGNVIRALVTLLLGLAHRGREDGATDGKEMKRGRNRAVRTREGSEQTQK